MEKIKSPFTDEQVENLNRYQECEWVHAFTCCSPTDIEDCKRKSGEDYGALIATNEGWICPCGKYKQDWAHAGMAADLPPDWRIEFFGDFLDPNKKNISHNQNNNIEPGDIVYLIDYGFETKIIEVDDNGMCYFGDCEISSTHWTKCVKIKTNENYIS